MNIKKNRQFKSALISLFQACIFETVCINFFFFSICFISSICVKCTYGKSVTEVVKPVSHDDHPGERGHAGLLEVLDRVGVCVSVRVCVRVVVLGVVVMQYVVIIMVVMMLLI